MSNQEIKQISEEVYETIYETSSSDDIYRLINTYLSTGKPTMIDNCNVNIGDELLSIGFYICKKDSLIKKD